MEPAHRELYLLRHAKSSWSSDAASDFDRPLAGRGRKDAPRVGDGLREQGVAFAQVVSSPARRARETVEAVLEAAGLDPGQVRWEPRVYGAGREDLLAVLADCDGPGPVLLVGHNPGLDDLLAHLCGPAAGLRSDRKRLTTAALARVRLPARWAHLPGASGELLSLTRPRDQTAPG